MDRFGYERAGINGGNAMQRLADAAVDWLRSRRVEHWIMFLAGLALGAILG